MQPLGLADEIRLASAVDARHRVEVERFHRRTALVHAGSVRAECTPCLDAAIHRHLAGRQVPIGIRPLGKLEAAGDPAPPWPQRQPSARKFAATECVDYARLRRFLLAAYCGPADQPGRAAAPSAGAGHPVHVLLVSLARVRGAPFSPGHVVHVSFLERALHLLARACPGTIEEACFGSLIAQEGGSFKNAAFMIVYVFDLDAGTVRYGARGYRFGLLECGAMTQQAALVAERFGFGSCLFGGFADSQLALALGLRPRSMLVLCVQVFGQGTPS